MIDKDIIIPIILLIAICVMYSTKLTDKTFFANIYLYLALAVSLILLLSKYLGAFRGYGYSSFLIYLLIAIISISLIYSNNLLVSHIGFIIIILTLAASIPLVGQNIRLPLILTIGLFIILSIITIFFLSDQTKDMIMKNRKYVIGCLLILTIFLLVAPLLKANIIADNIKIISIISIIIFILLLIGDTIIRQRNSYDLVGNHLSINYPKESISLILDFLNIFINIYNLTRS